MPRAALLLAAAAAAACSVPNQSHCAHNDGPKTCSDRGLGPYCSLCVSSNDGCVATPPAGDCMYAADTQPATSSTSTTSPTTTAATSSSTTTGEPDPSTSAPPTTTSSSSSSATSTTDTGDTTATTGPTPSCGNDMREGNEVCDGADLDDQTCNKVNDKWGGGVLQCVGTCTAFDQSMCCLNVGQTCIPGSMNPNEKCCEGSTCTVVTCM